MLMVRLSHLQVVNLSQVQVTQDQAVVQDHQVQVVLVVLQDQAVVLELVERVDHQVYQARLVQVV
jgi:hypothetical protein